MGFLFDEKAYVESNIALHEERLSSQFSRFLDSSPTFVTYYRINNIETSTDTGYLNVERTLGRNSPIKFNEVSRLPLYGMEQIVLDLQDNDEGITTSYEGSGTILPNTVIPRPGDYFIIDHIGSSLVMVVTSFSYDTFRSNGYYKIDFKVTSVDDGTTHSYLKNQTVDKFICYHENIGTEDKVLMREDDVGLVNRLNDIVTKVSNYYMMLYYDERYNSFLFNRYNGQRVYDRVLTRFMMKHKLFTKKNGFHTIHLADEDSSKFIELEYHNSIYRALEQRDASIITDVKYYESYVFDIQSVFTRWRDNKVVSAIQGHGVKDYIRPELLQMFREAKDLFAPDSSNVDDLNNTDSNRDQLIKLPTVNDGPIYVKDQNILTGESVIMSEEEALSIPREYHEYDSQYDKNNNSDLNIDDDTGGINLDRIFGDESDDSEDIDIEVNKDVFPEDEEVMMNIHDYEITENGVPEMESSEPSRGITIHVEKSIPDYLKTPEKYKDENIVSIIIAKYFSGHPTNLYDINIDDLEDYMSYMDLNSFETFILIPMFLYVIEQYFINHLGN